MAIVLPKLSRVRSSAVAASDTSPSLTIELCRETGCYEVSKPLRAHWRVGQQAMHELIGLEVSVLWYTEGKGDEDLHVHHFARWNDTQLQQLDLSTVQTIDCILPPSPLSYEGTLLRIRWCVRVRSFYTNDREYVAQQPFHLIAATESLSPMYS